MKKLNITKKQYDESKYFNKKYGALKFVSESGKLFKTDKGVVLALESEEDEDAGAAAADDGTVSIDGGADSEAEVTVKKEDLADALQGVIDTVKDIAADNDVELPEDKEDDEEDGEDKDDEDAKKDGEFEFDEGEEICPTCGAKKCAKECGGSSLKKECLKEATRARRAKMVREAIARRARARKVLESIRRRRAAKRVLESIRRRRAQKKVMEARRLRAARNRKVMESRRLRARRARLAK